MALKNKVKFELLADPDDPTVLILSPIGEELQDGSKYTINIKNVIFEDGTNYSEKEEFITTPDNYYFVSVSDVQDLVHGLKLDEENILHHIIDASKTAMYWAKRKLEDARQMPDFNSPTFQEDYYPFYMFIKLHATVEALKEFLIQVIASPQKWRDVLSDLEREEEWDFDAIKDLIDDFEKEAEEWLELVVTITADPKWALRGKYCYTAFYTYSNPYHRIRWGMPPHNSDYNRGY
jgi:hypothetical protein